MDPSNANFRIRCATPDQLEIIIGLIDAAADWLRKKKHTRQWRKPWPSPEGRYQRVREGILGGHTWIAWDGEVPAATVSIYDSGNPELWGTAEQKIEAVYLHRLVVHRAYTGIGLGTEMINWVGKKGRRDNPKAKLIRIDVWTDNEELHTYYKKRGFRFVDCRFTSDNCPSGALFQKPIQQALQADTSRIVEDSSEEETPRGQAGPWTPIARPVTLADGEHAL